MKVKNLLSLCDRCSDSILTSVLLPGQQEIRGDGITGLQAQPGGVTIIRTTKKSPCISNQLIQIFSSSITEKEDIEGGRVNQGRLGSSICCTLLATRSGGIVNIAASLSSSL
jgi:hypothetical protein